MAGEELAAKAGMAAVKEILPIFKDIFGMFRDMAGFGPSTPTVTGPVAATGNAGIAQAIEKVAFSIQRLATVIEEKGK